MPFNYSWDKSIKGGHCANFQAACIAVAVTDILGDLMIIGKSRSEINIPEEKSDESGLPMPWIWNLKVSTGNKIALTVLFATGVV